MPRPCWTALFAALSALGQNEAVHRTPEFPRLLTFEAEHSGPQPKGWNGGPPDTLAVDKEVTHGGKFALRIERTTASRQDFSQASVALPIDFAGASIQLRGFLKTEDVSGFAGFWLREDGDSAAVAFDNMQSREIKGTRDWTEYTITLPLVKAAKRVYLGVLLAGTGKVWADDLQFLVDGKPVSEAPRIERPLTAIDRDKEFDGGSKIGFEALTPAQAANLVLLGKVWGFLKYHQPRVTGGEFHWDYELFRILPSVLAAADSSAARTAIREWIARRIGEPAQCAPCAKLDASKLHFGPRLDWLADSGYLGPELSRDLQAIHANRSSNQFFVSLSAISHPQFQHEPAYSRLRIPDAGFQLLAVYRFWNMVEYWFPYRDIVGEDWDRVLAEFIPRVALAKTKPDYERAMMALIARVHDGHANLWSGLASRPPVGTCQIPAEFRFVEGKPVVTGFPGAAPESSALKRGDAVETVGGVAAEQLIRELAPFYAASNDAVRLRDIARFFTRGECGSAALGIRRGQERIDVAVQRVPEKDLKFSRTRDLPGDTFRKLSKDVAYLKLSAVKANQASKYVESAAGSKGLIVDIRNYPSEFMVFALGQHLVKQQTPFVIFTHMDLANPGSAFWGKEIALEPASPHYEGKVVIVVDDLSLSQSEYTAMAFRASPNARVVGSATAGADGNVVQIPLPFASQAMFSGLGVFYPDKRPTQRVGIIPDVSVVPTIEGIRAGRDEVLEAAIREIVGASVSDTEIQTIARH